MNIGPFNELHEMNNDESAKARNSETIVQTGQVKLRMPVDSDGFRSVT